MYDDRYVTALRSTQWQVAWEMMLQRPWLGWGLRNFTPVYQIEMNVWMGHPHNLFLMLLAEIGIPGLLILGGVVGSIMFGSVKLLILWSRDYDLFDPQKEQLEQSNFVSDALFYGQRHRQHLLLFTYLVAFSMFVFFNCFDVSIFDLRLNLPGWILLSAIAGIVYRYQSRLKLFY
jgi:O-antigen ligase